jgi:hydroxymethylpyrimidine/phosphomethylpyrimidine kinase
MAFPCVLTIGGTDPSGGAGLTADARACTAFGAHALPVVTAIVAQNTQGVLEWEAVSPSLLAAQLDHLLQDIKPQAVKTGLIPSAEAVKIIVSRLEKLHVPVIVDPVFAPSSGAAFSDDKTIGTLCELLLPMAEVLTPNWIETSRLLNLIIDEAPQAAKEMKDRFRPQGIVIKGGHAPHNPKEVCDYFFDGERTHLLSAPRMEGIEVRGTGCMLASAIAAQRAHNVQPLEAIKNAKLWITEQIKNAQPIGKGRRVAV